MICQPQATGHKEHENMSNTADRSAEWGLYIAAKLDNPGVIVLAKRGDCWEAYGEDAEIVARNLQLTLITTRTPDGWDDVMAGIPDHSKDAYLGQLCRWGRRVIMLESPPKPSQIGALKSR